MATIKSYTDIEQSKKLEEILPLESADMYHSNHPLKRIDIKYLPCWSLAALIDILPILDNRSPVISKTFDGKYKVFYHESGIVTSDYDNPVDACYNMILKLYELKML